MLTIRRNEIGTLNNRSGFPVADPCVFRMPAPGSTFRQQGLAPVKPAFSPIYPVERGYFNVT